MPLRDDLLQPVEGDNPSGVNLQYDVKVFDAIKEARVEDDESISTGGTWDRAPKRADRVLVIKLAGETLAKRSKDIRLAGWYLESLIRKEGFGQLAAGLTFFHKLQEEFWDTVYPEKDPDDGSLDLRIGAVESASSVIAGQLRLMPITKNGINLIVHDDARSLGFDKDSRSPEKEAIRRDAIAQGRMIADDLEKAVNETPKAFYVDLESQFAASLEILDEIERFNEEKYGDDYPSTSKLKSAIQAVQGAVAGILIEKRKLEPDPVIVPEPTAEELAAQEAAAAEAAAAPASTEEGEGAVAGAPRRAAPVGVATDKEGAYLQVAACAELLRRTDPRSAVPYLLCSALRLGETRTADLEDFNFAVAPATAIRQAMRKLSREQKWDELMKLCIQTLPEPCGRVWLDLQRYIWAAATGLDNQLLASIVLSTVRSLLHDLPALRMLTLTDDTSAANTETQMWIDAEVMAQS